MSTKVILWKKKKKEKKRITAEIKLKPHSQVSRAELSTHAPKNFKKTKNVTYNCRHTSSSRRIHSFVFVPVDQWLRRSLSNTCAAFWAGDSREIPFTLYERGFTLGSNSTSIICTVQSLSGFYGDLRTVRFPTLWTEKRRTEIENHLTTDGFCRGQEEDGCWNLSREFSVLEN